MGAKQMLLLTCSKCDKIKNKDSFYRSTTHKNLLTGECKDCVRERVNASHKRPHRLAYMSSTAGKKYCREKFRNYMNKHPSRCAVRAVTSAAIESGKLVRPHKCSKCGHIGKIEAHHDDYNKALEVRWLCKRCHTDWHNHNTPIYNDN